MIQYVAYPTIRVIGVSFQTEVLTLFLALAGMGFMTWYHLRNNNNFSLQFYVIHIVLFFLTAMGTGRLFYHLINSTSFFRTFFDFSMGGLASVGMVIGALLYLMISYLYLKKTQSGFELLTGQELADNIKNHALKFGAEYIEKRVHKVHKNDDGSFGVHTKDEKRTKHVQYYLQLEPNSKNWVCLEKIHILQKGYTLVHCVMVFFTKIKLLWSLEDQIVLQKKQYYLLNMHPKSL